MKVKIGDKIHDGDLEPVMVILSKEDKENIRKMPKRCTKYACCPDSYGEEEMKAWMKLKEEPHPELDK